MTASLVSVLDGDLATWVEELWRHLDTEFGIERSPDAQVHLSYQVADRYDENAFEAVLRRAARRPPFETRTSGILAFTAPDLVVSLSVVRSPPLSALHADLWTEAADHGTGVVERFDPDRWMPHVTLTLDGIDRDDLGTVVESLSHEELGRTARIDNVAYLRETNDGQELTRVPFGG